MAYAVKRSTISSAAANSIRTMLCLQPDTPNSKYNRGNVPDPILFYNIDGDTVHLPYLFAASLFQTTPNIDIPYPITPLEFTGHLRENQITVEAESWDQLEQYGTSTLGLYPGFGKTILGAKLASRSKLMTVILVHREILTIQWKKTFEDFTNGRVWIVGEKHPPPICDVIICMDTRWHLLPSQMRESIGFLIIDEAHAFCTPTHVSCLLAFHPKYILIESATIHRDDGMDAMIYAIAGNHGVFRESNKPFSVMKIMTNTKPPRKHNRMGGVDWSSLVQDTLMDERRNRIILETVSRNTQFKILILTSLRDHATMLYNYIDQMGIPSDYLCGTKRGYKDSVVLVGTISKIGTGFDPATSCPSYSGRPFDLLLLVCSVKKYSMLVQNVGRIFRSEFPTVMHFVDNDDIYKSHWYKARKWYISHGGIITEHTIENKEQPVITTTNITASQQNWAQTKANQLVLKYQDPTNITVSHQNWAQTKANQLVLKYQDPTSLHSHLPTQGLTLNITNSDPLTTIQTSLHTIQPIGQNLIQSMTIIPKVELNTDTNLTMTFIPQIPLQPLKGQSPLIFGRRSFIDPTGMLSNNPSDANSTESPILSVKTEATKQTESPILSVKTEATKQTTFVPSRFFAPIKCDILPTLPIKTEPLKQIEIRRTLTMKTEPHKHIEITPTLTMKTEPHKHIEITPTLTMKTEPHKYIEITPTLTVKTELPKQVEITPTLAAKTELPKQVEILSTLTVKTEPPTNWDILPTESVVAITGE